MMHREPPLHELLILFNSDYRAAQIQKGPSEKAESPKSVQHHEELASCPEKHLQAKHPKKSPETKAMKSFAVIHDMQTR